MPYLLNPAGITLLVIFSGAIDSWLMLGILVIMVLLVAALDWLIFRQPRLHCQTPGQITSGGDRGSLWRAAGCLGCGVGAYRSGQTWASLTSWFISLGFLGKRFEANRNLALRAQLQHHCESLNMRVTPNCTLPLGSIALLANSP